MAASLTAPGSERCSTCLARVSFGDRLLHMRGDFASAAQDLNGQERARELRKHDADHIIGAELAWKIPAGPGYVLGPASVGITAHFPVRATPHG